MTYFTKHDSKVLVRNLHKHDPLYSYFLFNLTITRPLILAGRGNILQVEPKHIGTLHIAHLNLGEWSFSMIVALLN